MTERPLVESIDERMLTAEEIHQRYHVSPNALAVMRHRGRGPAGVKVGKRVLYPEREVLRWLNRQPMDGGATS